MRRKRGVSREVLASVLLKSRRRCALCHRAGDALPKMGDVAHIIPVNSGGTDDLDNLVFLCPMHHEELDTREARGEVSPEELKKARETLYRAVEQQPDLRSGVRSRVFLVHGRDDVAKDEVVSFLNDSGVEAVLLSDEPMLGRSVFERLQSYADVGYALVLLTPDKSRPDARPTAKGRYRARQNVIFELGYFVGRLGRTRVCALYKPSVELPSDFHGIPYVEMDTGGNWRRAIIQELRDSGLPVPALIGARATSLHAAPKMPCLLLLDVSGSMAGVPLEKLTAGLRDFVADLRTDEHARAGVELALVTFGDSVVVSRNFSGVDEFEVPTLYAGGPTPMGQAINLGLDLIDQRIESYETQGQPHYRPVILLVTDGSPTDSWGDAVSRLHRESTSRRIRFIAVGVEGADMEILREIAPPSMEPLKLRELRFSQMFMWVSAGVRKTAEGTSPEEPPVLATAEWAAPS